MRRSRRWSGRRSCRPRLARFAGAGLGALLLLLGGLAPEASAVTYWLQRIDVSGQLIDQSSGTGVCPDSSASTYYYPTYTDSRYRVGDVAHFFLLLDATYPPPSWWAIEGTLATWLRGIQVRPHCPTLWPCACEGQVGSQLFTPHEPQAASSLVRTSYPFTALSGYAGYADRVRALGGTPAPQGSWVAFGYAGVDLSAAGGSHTVTDVRGPLGGAGCGDGCPEQTWQWAATPYETRKSFSGEGVVLVPEEHCGDGLDGNGNGLVDETCWGTRDGPPPPAPPPPPNGAPVCSSCNLASGNLTDTIPLLAFEGGPLPLAFRVTYNSLDPLVGRVGRGWTHSLRPHVRDVSTTKLVLVSETGGWTEYRHQGDGTYLPLNRPVRDRIVKQANGTYERTWPDGRRWRFNSLGQLLEQHDRNGNVVRFTYDSANTLTQVTDPAGRTLSVTYDASGRVTQVADSAGRVVSFVYAADTTSHLLTIVDAAGGHWDFTYDSAGRMLTKTTPRGQVVRYGYTAGRLTSVTDPATVTRQLSYDPAQATTRILEPDGATRLQKWNGRINAPVTATDPSGRTTTYGYLASGYLRSVTDAAGQVWGYTYDPQGRLLTATDPLTRVTRYTYDGASDRVATQTAPDGAVTGYTYDAAGNLTAVTDPTGRTTTFAYDARGNLTAITDPAAQTTTFTYDAQNRLTSSTDPTGVSLTYTSDAVGRLASVTDAAGATTTYTYDALNRLIRLVDPLTHATTFAYDAMGNRTSQTDALLRVTQFAYDARGLLTSTTDPAGGVTTYGYTSRQWLTSLTDAESRTTTWTYDAAGRVLTETDPLGRVTTHQYDARGLRQFTTTPKAETLESQYDAVGRLTARVLPGGVTESYTYDVNGRLATATGGGVTDTFAYDAAGRVTSVTDSRGYVVSYGYDAAGRRVTLTYPGGQILTYGYDVAGRPTSLLDGARTITLGYDPVGRRASLTHPNGTRTTYGYDLASRLTSLGHATSSGTPLQSFTYGYDAADSRTSLTTLTQSLGYGYDQANRLTGVTAAPGSPIPSEAFTYDRVGNRLTGPAPADGYTYTAGHQLLTGPGASYTHDLNGNRATKVEAAGTTTYTWDAVNRLVQAAVPTATGTTTVSYAYDALGRRVRKTVAETSGGVTTTTTTEHVYDQEDVIWQVATVQVGVGVPTTTTTRYVHGPGIDEPWLVEQGGQVASYHADGLGSVTGLSDGSQTLVEGTTYTSFGRLARSGGVAGNPYAYTGREWEPELGLHYYRARYYDPEAGRFLSRDPIGLRAGDANLYAYVRNDPINRIDPDGQNILTRGYYCWQCRKYREKLVPLAKECRDERAACRTIEDELAFMDKYRAAYIGQAIYNCVQAKADPETWRNFLYYCARCGSFATGPDVWPRQ